WTAASALRGRRSSPFTRVCVAAASSAELTFTTDLSRPDPATAATVIIPPSGENVRQPISEAAKAATPKRRKPKYWENMHHPSSVVIQACGEGLRKSPEGAQAL